MKLLTLFIYILPILAFSNAKAQGESFVGVTVESPAMSLPMGAMRVPVLHLRMQAPCTQTVGIHSISLKLSGPGDVHTIERVYLLDGSARISRAMRFNGERELTMRIASFSIDACTEKIVTVAADISAASMAAGSYYRWMVTSVDAGSTSVHIEQVSSVPSVKIIPSTIGKVSATVLPLVQSLRYGTNQTIARIQIHAEEQNQLIHSITLTNLGSASADDVQDIVAKTRSQNSESNIVPNFDGKKATLTFNPPVSVGKGNTLFLQIKATIRASRKKTIRMTIEEPSDISAETDHKRTRK